MIFKKSGHPCWGSVLKKIEKIKPKHIFKRKWPFNELMYVTDIQTTNYVYTITKV
jgi:hypothetical protein